MPVPIAFEDGGRVQDTVNRRFWNMYVEATPGGPSATRCYPRHGLTVNTTIGTGPIRAVFFAIGHFFVVSGDEVYCDAALIGTVDTSEGFLRYSYSAEEVTIVDVPSKTLYYVTASAVTEIVDLDVPSCIDTKFLDGRFLYTLGDFSGSYAYSAINDAQTIDGLSFATAESDPDPLNGMELLGDSLLLFGTKTVEWHYSTNDPDAPYIRSKGRRYDKGTPSIRSVVRADNALFFLGNDRIIYRTGQVPVRVSNHDLEDRIRYMANADLLEVTAFMTIFSGHTFYVINLPGQGTWAYDISTKKWAKWTSYNETLFRIDCGDDEGVFLGDRLSGKIMTFLWNAHDDDGDPIERVVSAFVPIEGGVQRNTNVVLHCSKGVGLLVGDAEDVTPVVEMRFSDQEGGNFSNWLDQPLGTYGDRSKAAMAHWTALGCFQAPGRLYEYRCSARVFWSPYMMTYNQLRP